MVWRLRLLGARLTDAYDLTEVGEIVRLPLSSFYSFNPLASLAIHHIWSPVDHWRFPASVRNAIKWYNNNNSFLISFIPFCGYVLIFIIVFLVLCW